MEYYSAPSGWEARVARSTTAEQERKIAAKRARYAAERDLLQRHLSAIDPPRRVLDFGCGLGAWLDVLQDDGWETWGLEPGPQQRAYASRRHRIVDDLPAERLFDFVVVNHVFEHLRAPLETMRRLAEVTLLGGLVFVSVPDFGRLGEHGKWNYVKNERHIVAYTTASLSSLMGLAGYAVVEHLAGPEWDAIAPSERWRLKMLGRYTGQPIPPRGRPLDQALVALRQFSEHDYAMPRHIHTARAIASQVLIKGRRALRAARR